MKVATDKFICALLSAVLRLTVEKTHETRVIHCFFFIICPLHSSMHQVIIIYHTKRLYFKVILCLTFWAARCRAVLRLWSVLFTSAPAFRRASAQSSLSANTQYISGVLPNWSSLSLRAAFPMSKRNRWWHLIIVVVITNMIRDYIYWVFIKHCAKCVKYSTSFLLTLSDKYYHPWIIGNSCSEK